LKDSFAHIINRKCEIIIEPHSAITSRHFIDCTAGIYFGSNTTFAGIRSQILTHSIDLTLNRQHAEPIFIGKNCFIGTNCVFLPGSKLPDYTILGAKSLLNKAFEESDCLYGGVPAKRLKALNRSKIAYFNRVKGYVN